MAYDIRSNVEVKGVRYDFRTAIKNFLQHHRLEGKIEGFDPNSEHTGGVMVLYDNGVYDVNITALLDHLNNSGRLPSNEKFRPSDITVRPL